MESADLPVSITVTTSARSCSGGAPELLHTFLGPPLQLVVPHAEQSYGHRSRFGNAEDGQDRGPQSNIVWA
jgi:hypothetical protein